MFHTPVLLLPPLVTLLPVMLLLAAVVVLLLLVMREEEEEVVAWVCEGLARRSSLGRGGGPRGLASMVCCLTLLSRLDVEFVESAARG